MSAVLERGLGILECLAGQPEGLPLGAIADRLKIPPSATHRLLIELVDYGYVRQVRDQGDYALSTKLVAMVLDYMGATGIVDFAQPVLDRLAQESGEFVRLAVIDGERLTWVARSQGARRGLRYDPEIDATVRLSCTASGQAWLMTLSDVRALALVKRQGFGATGDYGPNAPASATDLARQLALARKRGYALTVDSFGVGLSSIAVPVRRGSDAVIGVLSIAGPTARLDAKRLAGFAPELHTAARDIALASATSPLFATLRARSEVAMS
ncbi:MAG: IclR family transcriptional regulator [Hyphomicrobiaceae bacterium]|nr:IclR family transcriptional regulator [Hyphomicrobiaceae bacterium]